MAKRLRVPVGYKAQRVVAPAMPGPFINTKLLSVGFNEHGVERFWTSTFNTNAGTIGFLADENGEMTAYRFGLPHVSFYSAAVEDTNTLWLCGDLSRFVRLRLDTGMIESFPTDAAPTTTTFTGMAFDPATRRLFCGGILSCGASFDIATKQAVTYKDRWPSRNMYNSFPNGDGTWSLVFNFPGALMRWIPRSHAVVASSVTLADAPINMLHRLVHDERWGWYLPTLGWYDGMKDRLVRDGPRPQREMMWFARRARRVLGCAMHGSDMQVCEWDLDSSRVDELVRISNMSPQNVSLSRRGDIVAMSIDGVFRIFDGSDTGLKLAREAPARSVGAVDCLRLIDRDRLLGTTFITQRFWEADLATGRSRDCGLAAPGVGEVLQTWRIGKRIYMAAYIGGELVEYDPAQPAAFPANPRVVAQHPLAMRPIASASRGRLLWYACSRMYGQLGAVLFRYDTRTGHATWTVDPLGPRMITSLMLSPSGDEMLCGSSIHADHGTADPTVDESMLARIGSDDLVVRATRCLPSPRVEVLGWVSRSELLCLSLSQHCQPFVVDASTLHDLTTGRFPTIEQAASRLPVPVRYVGTLGRFVVQIEDRLELHDLRRRSSLVRVLLEGIGRHFHPFDWQLDDHSVLLRRPGGEVVVIHDLLKSRPESRT